MYIKQLDLKLPLPGYYKFFSSFVYLDDNANLFIIDTGPGCTIGLVLNAIRELSFTSLTMLLTHVHVDHAGGASELCTEIANLYTDKISLECYLYDQAIQHLMDPSRLWQGTVVTLGQELSEAMRCPARFPSDVPVHAPFSSRELKESEAPLTFFREFQTANGKKILVIPTPGHALHHVNYIIDDTMFVGESLGVIYPDSDYLRPATPPVFKRSVYEESILRLKNLTENSIKIKKHAYAHFGLVDACQSSYDYALWQIQKWCDYVGETKKDGSLTEYLAEIDKHIENLASVDERFSCFYKLPQEVQQRERKFIGNTLSGIFG